MIVRNLLFFSGMKKPINQNKMSRNCVTNGCSGHCCEDFNFKFSIEELDVMIQGFKDNKESVQLRDNLFFEIKETTLDEIQKIRDMIIPLGLSDIDPQRGTTYNSRWLSKGWNREDITSEKVVANNSVMKWFIIENNTISTYHYTCKHFDKKKRICTNYEQRPNMCRVYGEGCQYKGCKFTEIAAKEVKERV
jgi:Fe-S-cluster containining protein